MNAQLNQATKTVADKLIAMGRRLHDDMETWQEVQDRVPDSSSKNTTTGFVAKPHTKSGIEMNLDVIAPEEEDTAKLRIWAIHAFKDESENERFNNIQLGYALDRTQAQDLIKQSKSLSLDDLANLLHDPNNTISEITISDETGREEKSQQTLGKRYDLDDKDIASLNEADTMQLIYVMENVLSNIERIANNQVQ